MMIPTIHLNGTGKTTLLDELKVAHGAVTAAVDALRQVTVHGRDYYPQGPDAYKQARHEMDERLRSMNDIAVELQAMYLHLQRQNGGSHGR